jgi:hypothetical protein
MEHGGTIDEVIKNINGALKNIYITFKNANLRMSTS